MTDTSIFARHLDLSPLGLRRRGLVRCPFHQDRTASLSVDLDAGVFHCFGCGQQGGVKAFAQLVGEAPASPITREGGRSDETWWDIAIRLAHAQPWARGSVVDIYAISDWLRHTRRAIGAARGRPDVTEDVLEAAAALETLAAWVEAELDDVLSTGPMP